MSMRAFLLLLLAACGCVLPAAAFRPATIPRGPAVPRPGAPAADARAARARDTRLHESGFQRLFKSFQPNCKASHILLRGDDDENRARLEEVKAEVGDDLVAFGKAARRMSTCSSKNSDGSLGLFTRGQMVKEFDDVCFGPEYEVGVTHGPIKTKFGWHLIHIKTRKLS